MSLLFTSDLHLGHANILTSRPQFSDIDEHDQYIIKRWNKKVKANDEVYILGDMIFRSSHSPAYYLSNLKGRKHLIIGNHDEDWMRRVDNLSEYFESVDYFKIINFQKKQLVFSHYPMLEWPGSRYEDSKSYLVHGHIHTMRGPRVYGYIRQYLPKALNAGVDINGFVPVTFEELVENNDVWYERD